MGRREATAHRAARSSSVEIVGREAELAAIDAFLGGAGARALVFAGDAGIGKTTLWESALAAAREQGFRVLATRASGAETRMSHTGLVDLLDDVDDAELAGLPTPQRHALEVALLRVEPPTRPQSRPSRSHS
ncbi:MAG: AAA family ATPase [Gaiellales bacterium]